MKQLVILVLLMVFAFTITTFSFDDRRFPYDWNDISSKISQVIPDGWLVGGVIEIEYLNKNSREEFVAVHLREKDSYAKYGPYLVSSQIAIFQWGDDDLRILWKSDIFTGDVSRISFEDSNNNGRSNINLQVRRKENEIAYGNLIIYDWNGPHTQKVYPLGDMPELRTEAGFLFIKNGDQINIITKTIIEKEPYLAKEDYYILTDNQIKHIEERYPNRHIEIKSSTVDKYQEIIDYIRTNTSRTVERVHNLLYQNLFLIELAQSHEKFEDPKYVIIEFDKPNIRIWYYLDYRLNSFGFSPYNSSAIWDDEGYFSLYFGDLIDWTVYYYIISLRPDGPVMLNPVDEEFRSLWFESDF